MLEVATDHRPICPRSARVSRLSDSPARIFGVSPKQPSEKTVIARCNHVCARRARNSKLYRGTQGRMGTVCLALLASSICSAQNPSPTPTLGAESEPIVITATRIDIPLDQSPASVTLLTSQDFEEKQIERVADALREVPGLSVAQSGTPGQLTSVFTRGLRSEHTQVLLDGIPINQGLAGQMDFADFTTDDIDRIEVARGPQSTLYGPRALAGAIQIFTKRGEGDPVFMLSSEGGSYGTFREALES